MKLFKKLSVIIAISAIIVGCGEKNKNVSTLKIGHVGHDHHLSLFIALDMAEENPSKFCPPNVNIKKIMDKSRYELHKNGKNIMNLNIVKVGGGSKMPTALSQGVIDIGYGGVAPVLAAIDNGSPIKIISPLHSKGDMFVLNPKSSANTWSDFVKIAKSAKKPIRIGYKNPVAVAKIIFENALTHEGISFASNSDDNKAKIILVNVKGGGKLNVSLGNEIIEGYVGNNPFPAIGAEKGLLKVICELENLPPQNFKNHPCCCIAAVPKSLEGKTEVIKILMSINKKAIDLINCDLSKSAKIASRWIGSSEKAEKESIPTSGYSMNPSENWHKTMSVWNKAMNKLDLFKKELKGLSEEQMGQKAYDFQYLKE